jgi:hypothetical protein
MDIQFNAVTPFQCSPKGRHGILRTLGIMKTPVGIIPIPQFRQTGLTGTASQRQDIQQRQYDQ